MLSALAIGRPGPRAGCNRRAARLWLRPVPSELPTSMTDGDLARAVAERAGRPEEAVLVERFARRVFLYGMRHLGDEARADDLVQDVMTTVLERLRAGEVREPDRIGSFVLGTARVLARDARRRERRAAEVASAASREGDVAIEPRDPVDVEQLAAALAELTERERAIVVLTFQEDRSAVEIADELGLTPGNVRVIRHRAVARLGALLGAGEDLGDGGAS